MTDAKMRAALERYGRHDSGCRWWGERGPCSCGYDEARQALASAPVDQDGVSAATKRMAKTLGAEFVRDPSKPCRATPTDLPATGDGAEDAVERLMDEAYRSADCPTGGPYALSWEQAEYMVRAALASDPSK